jgi:hypothetical protein
VLVLVLALEKDGVVRRTYFEKPMGSREIGIYCWYEMLGERYHFEHEHEHEHDLMRCDALRS